MHPLFTFIIEYIKCQLNFGINKFNRLSSCPFCVTLPRMLRPIDIITIYYLLSLNFITLLFRPFLPHWYLYFFAHFMFTIFIFLLGIMRKRYSNKVVEFVSYFYPWFSTPQLYEETRTYLHVIFPGFFDHLVQKWEFSLFGVLPNIYLEKFACPWLTEILSFGYISYYLFFLIPPFVFYFCKRDGLEELIFSMALVYYISFLGFILFPVASPRFALAGQFKAPLQGYLIPKIQAQLMETFALRGGAMPSSHVAMAVASTLVTKRYFRRIYPIMLILAVLIMLGAIYGRYHYVTDVVVGAILGIIAAKIAHLIYKK